MWEKRVVGGGVLHIRRICGFEKFRTISSGYLKISRIKESPQFGWVKKLQRTVGFQTVWGEYQPWYLTWSTTGLVTISNTQPLPYKYIAPITKHTDQRSHGQKPQDRRTDRTSIWVSGLWHTDGWTGSRLSGPRRTGPRLSGPRRTGPPLSRPQRTDGRTDGQGN